VRLASAPVVGALVAAALVATGSGCGGGGTSAGPSATVTVVVGAPVSTSPWIATFERRGAELAARQVNAAGGIDIAGRRHRLEVRVEDNAGSPQQAAAIARRAVADGAAALVIDGVGAAAVADVTDPAHLPTFVVFDGGDSIIDPQRRPALFRLAPADRFMTMRLADYLAGSRPRVAVLADDSSYGADGRASLAAAFARDDVPVVATATVPATTSDVSVQVLAARRAGATQLVTWAGAPVVAATVAAARSAGWKVPVWAGPSGEDPLVRQRLAAHPEWLSDVGFVSFRITAEVGPAPFAAYRRAYVAAFGTDLVGVRQDGREVVQPPDWSMLPYDAVRLVASALGKAGGTGTALLATLAGGDVVTGANGDERGYSATSREGVSPDDMYVARFHGFVFAPVTDDLLSQNLPTVPQTR
jgi:ABC-type branched-subunit amino acid transport system substrate-binding protein